MSPQPRKSKSRTEVPQSNGTSRNEHGIRASQAAPALIDYYAVISMVFGACCGNVLTYEQLLITNPRIGSALTFSQMLFITFFSLPSFLSYSSSQWIPRFKPRQVPLSQWALQVIMLTTGSLLNNWAFAYNIPLSILIVFRSAGLSISMLLGALILKKRYTAMQVASVLIVSVGVVIATLAKPTPASASAKTVLSAEELRRYQTGIAMLVVSLFATGTLGILQEQTYKKYGPCWKEGVFYTHFLSLPIFLFLGADVKQGIVGLSGSSPKSTMTSFAILAANMGSQWLCVSGVTKLSSQVSSVSLNLVLTARKAFSLCFSVFWFGNGWNAQLGVGAALVFVGSFLYTLNNDKKAEKSKKTG